MKDLKVSYQRNLKSNQLIFEPEEKYLLELKSKYAFELGMIEHNNIKNFLIGKILIFRLYIIFFQEMLVFRKSAAVGEQVLNRYIRIREIRENGFYFLLKVDFFRFH